MSSYFKYRLFCVTEDQNVETPGFISEDQGAPTVCPNNDTHTIDTESVTIIDSIQDADVHIAGVNDGVLLPEQSKAFPDRTGYNVFVPGHRFVATAGQVNNFDVTYSADYKLQGMGFRVGDTVADGDKVAIQIVDVDGSVYPAGTVLVTFAQNLYVWPGREFTVICEDVKTMYSWAYLRLVYDSAGDTDDVVVYWQHHLRTIPA